MVDGGRAVLIVNRNPGGDVIMIVGIIFILIVLMGVFGGLVSAAFDPLDTWRDVVRLLAAGVFPACVVWVLFSVLRKPKRRAR